MPLLRAMVAAISVAACLGAVRSECCPCQAPPGAVCAAVCLPPPCDIPDTVRPRDVVMPSRAEELPRPLDPEDVFHDIPLSIGPAGLDRPARPEWPRARP